MSRPCVAGAVVLAAIIQAGPALAADLHVPSRHATIAAALAAAATGDRVVLAAGVYHEHGLDLPSGVTLLGMPSAPAAVVIDAGGNGRVMQAEQLEMPVTIKGVTLTGGRADGGNAHEDSGGGLMVDDATVRLEDVIVTGNFAAGNGGGLRVAGGVLDLVRCEVRGNTAGRGGGGLEACYGAACSIADAVFEANAAAWGGAVAVRFGSDAVVTGSRFEHNRAIDAPGLGGALLCDLEASLMMTASLLARNEANYGGGFYAATGAETDLTMVTIDRNFGRTTGGGSYSKGSACRFTRSIISFHPPSALVAREQGTFVMVGCNIHGNLGGDWAGELAPQFGLDDNFSADPLYCSSTDRRLQPGSPCLPANNGFGLVGAYGSGCGVTSVPPDATGTIVLSARPNPFNPVTEIVFDLPVDGRVRLSVFDIRGRRLDVLADEVRPAGNHRLRWEARDASGRQLASGAYLLVLETDGQRRTHKIMLAR